jgi:phospholipase/lecithinase/hemolysin
MRNPKIKIYLLACLICALLPLQAFAATNTFNQIVFFGDSLSDNGNLYEIDHGLLPKSPPYFKGRFSNGEVWSEMVSKYLTDKNFITASDDYAIGGESVLFATPKGPIPPFTLSYSLTDYLARNFFSDKSHTLFVLWLGANDYLSGSDDADKQTTDVVAGIEKAVDSLVTNGATNILLINLPDLSKIPMAANEGSDPVVLKQLGTLHNSKLQTALNNLQKENPSLTLKLFDINSVFADVIAHPETYNQKYQLHLSNVTTACWTGGYLLAKKSASEETIARDLNQQLTLQGEPAAFPDNTKAYAHNIANSPELYAAYLTGKQFADGVQPCTDPGAYLFWDYVHPSTAGHTIISQQLIGFITDNFTPA